MDIQHKLNWQSYQRYVTRMGAMGRKDSVVPFKDWLEAELEVK